MHESVSPTRNVKAQNHASISNFFVSQDNYLSDLTDISYVPKGRCWGLCYFNDIAQAVKLKFVFTRQFMLPFHHKDTDAIPKQLKILLTFCLFIDSKLSIYFREDKTKLNDFVPSLKIEKIPILKLHT